MVPEGQHHGDDDAPCDRCHAVAHLLEECTRPVGCRVEHMTQGNVRVGKRRELTKPRPGNGHGMHDAPA